jgi:hypothetical protein
LVAGRIGEAFIYVRTRLMCWRCRGRAHTEAVNRQIEAAERDD